MNMRVNGQSFMRKTTAGAVVSNSLGNKSMSTAQRDASGRIRFAKNRDSLGDAKSFNQQEEPSVFHSGSIPKETIDKGRLSPDSQIHNLNIANETVQALDTAGLRVDANDGSASAKLETRDPSAEKRHDRNIAQIFSTAESKIDSSKNPYTVLIGVQL